jgi:hypothetical protein
MAFKGVIRLTFFGPLAPIRNSKIQTSKPDYEIYQNLTKS